MQIEACLHAHIRGNKWDGLCESLQTQDMGGVPLQQESASLTDIDRFTENQYQKKNDNCQPP